jgi:L-ascorbate metabolism protein UlaG (beta-lactamase superfamily)
MATAPRITITLIGGPTALIEIDGLHLLTDPTFDPPGLYQRAPVHFEKTTGPAIAADALGPIDAVLLTHDQHLDNLDHAGRALLADVPMTYTTPAGATRLAANAVGLAPFETCTLTGRSGRQLLVTAVPARHGPPGIEPISGDVTGFVLGSAAAGDALYVSGDTVWYHGTAEVARRFAPRAVMLFTGSAEPRGCFHMTMDSNDAIEAAHAFPHAALFAVHNEGWVHFRESAADLAASFATLGLGHRLTTLQRGLPTHFD